MTDAIAQPANLFRCGRIDHSLSATQTLICWGATIMKTFAALVFAPVLLSSGAFAQSASWDGSWSGVTGRGSAIQLTIQGGAARSYVFRGMSVPVTGSKIAGSTATINVNGGAPAVITLQRRGNMVTYSYNGPEGTATATLSKQ
ncbi:MAG: hypothetical protein ABWZ80_11435 [Beijerinckiaceae bacterium]